MQKRERKQRKKNRTDGRKYEEVIKTKNRKQERGRKDWTCEERY